MLRTAKNLWHNTCFSIIYNSGVDVNAGGGGSKEQWDPIDRGSNLSSATYKSRVPGCVIWPLRVSVSHL